MDDKKHTRLPASRPSLEPHQIHRKDRGAAIFSISKASQGSHFFPLTNFPDFSLTFPVFFSFFPDFYYIFLWLLFNTSTCTKILFLQYPEVRIFTILHPKILSWNSNNSTLNTLWACSWDGVVHTLPKKGNFGIVFVGKIQLYFNSLLIKFNL